MPATPHSLLTCQAKSLEEELIPKWLLEPTVGAHKNKHSLKSYLTNSWNTDTLNKWSPRMEWNVALFALFVFLSPPAYPTICSLPSNSVLYQFCLSVVYVFLKKPMVFFQLARELLQVTRRLILIFCSPLFCRRPFPPLPVDLCPNLGSPVLWFAQDFSYSNSKSPLPWSNTDHD